MQEDAYLRGGPIGRFVQMTDSEELARLAIGDRWSADCDITSATPISASTYDLPITDLPSI